MYSAYRLTQFFSQKLLQMTKIVPEGWDPNGPIPFKYCPPVDTGELDALNIAGSKESTIAEETIKKENPGYCEIKWFSSSEKLDELFPVGNSGIKKAEDEIKASRNTKDSIFYKEERKSEVDERVRAAGLPVQFYQHKPSRFRKLFSLPKKKTCVLFLKKLVTFKKKYKPSLFDTPKEHENPKRKFKMFEWGKLVKESDRIDYFKDVTFKS